MTPRRPSRLFLVACFVVAGCVTPAPAANASFGIQSFEASYSEAPLAGALTEALDFQAGSHPYQVTAAINFNTTTNASGEKVSEGAVKNLQINLPRGVVGNPNGIPQCPMAAFAKSGLINGGAHCPTGTQVGVLNVIGGHFPLFNLKPSGGVAGQLGAVVFLLPIVIDLSIRNGSDYGLTAEIHNISQLFEIPEISLELWGVPADPRHDHLRCLERQGSSENCPSGAPVEPLLTMPSACGEPLTTTMVAESWEEPNASVKGSVTAAGAGGSPGEVSGCDRLGFSPSLAVQPESSVADTPTGLSVDVKIPYQNQPDGLAEANLKDVSIVFPAGLSINPAAGGGLAGCSPAQIALSGASQPTCPDASKVGTLEVEAPMLSKSLQGSIYVAESATNPFAGVMTVYLVAEGDGVDLKLPGQLSAQPSSGRLTLTLDNVPELPLTGLRLHLFGGPRAVIANPAVCGTFATSTELTPYSVPESNQPTPLSSSFAVDENCAGGFAPTFAGGATNSAAGQNTGFTIQLARADGQQYLQSLAATLPPGLLANTNAVPRCGDAEAAAGTCPMSSEVGTVAIGAGAGSDPYYLNGRVYFTGPYRGAQFGMSLVIPAAVGPFNLGTIVVRAQVRVAQDDLHLVIVTDPLPQILSGIPLRLRSLSLNVSRPGFMINPTNCLPMSVAATIESVRGASFPTHSPFQVSGCRGLQFAPKLAAATPAGAISRGDGAGLDVKITGAPGAHANLKSVIVNLPKPLKPRMTAVQQACVAATFVENPAACPPDSVVGKAAVDTPVLSSPLTGPVYLVYYRGVKYPKLVMVLQGGGVQIQLTGSLNVSKGISSTAFSPLPDVPMSLFEMDLLKGRNSVLGATEDLCAKRRSMPYTMIGQNGARLRGAVRIAVEGCRTRAARTGRRGPAKATPARSFARAGWRNR